MFSSKKKENDDKISSGNITTLIAEDCIIEGAIKSKAHVKIDGKTLGGVNAAGVILGQKGYIKGDVRTKELIAYGKIEGDAYAENLILKDSALISGNIQVKTLQIEAGAILKGVVTMDAKFSIPLDDETTNAKIEKIEKIERK
ncbi:MAG: polymer-forming cytoskeletal protein [Flavobacteriaceae bacterium]|jgi:cytoskeletal protein CcmA (bactofilin family)|nr:polymer-forming cytoskeletal protein [Flavobacteriaceae bacterium]